MEEEKIKRKRKRKKRIIRDIVVAKPTRRKKRRKLILGWLCVNNRDVYKLVGIFKPWNHSWVSTIPEGWEP